MSGSAGGAAVPLGWGGRSRLPDAERWRATAADAATDLAALAAGCLRVRPELAALDLATALRVLAAFAEGSHAFARLVQADQEAVELLTAAGAEVPDEVLAVFPPEVDAVRATPDDSGGWRLDGRQRRSTHPGAVTRGIAVASTAEGPRPFLFRTDAPGLLADDPVAPRLIAPEDPNRAVTFRAVPATPVATAGWWAARPPSSLGLLRDAACWFGACVWLCRALEASDAPSLDPDGLLRTGRVDVWVHAARLALRAAIPTAVTDPGSPAAELAARRAVATVATTGDTVIRAVARASDPRASGQDPALSIRVAQLQIALRRADPERNLAAIGSLLTGAPGREPGGD